MTGLPRPIARRWYLSGAILSLAAVVFGVVSSFAPRVGYPVAFCLTMFGVLAVIRPSWERPGVKARLLAVVSTVLLTQIAILWNGLAGA